MNFANINFIVTPKELKRLPPEVDRAVVMTTSTFKPPPGWHEAHGAVHTGKNRWLIPIERDEE